VHRAEVQDVIVLKRFERQHLQVERRFVNVIGELEADAETRRPKWDAEVGAHTEIERDPRLDTELVDRDQQRVRIAADNGPAHGETGLGKARVRAGAIAPAPVGEGRAPTARAEAFTSWAVRRSVALSSHRKKCQGKSLVFVHPLVLLHESRRFDELSNAVGLVLVRALRPDRLAFFESEPEL
jgi:hypothetical protein